MEGNNSQHFQQETEIKELDSNNNASLEGQEAQNQNNQQNNQQVQAKPQQSLEWKQQPQPQPKATIKFLLVGPAGSGKTSLMISYVQKTFIQQYLTTIGLDFRNKFITYENQIYKLQIWDCAGQQRFKSLSTAYYKNAHCIFLVYDTTVLEDLNKQLAQIRENVNQNAYICLVGTKCDLQDQKQITTQMGQKFATQNKLDFFEVNSIPVPQNDTLQKLFLKGVQWYIKNNQLHK